MATLLALFAVPVFLMAQETGDGGEGGGSSGDTVSYQVLAEGVPFAKNCTGGVCQVTGIGTFLSGIYEFLIGLAIIFAVFMIVIGGVQYMTTDAYQKKSDGRSKINQAILGLLLALAGWLILNTINPDLVTFKSIRDISEENTVEESSGGQGGSTENQGDE